MSGRCILDDDRAVELASAEPVARLASFKPRQSALHLHQHQLSASTLRHHLPLSFSFLPLLTLALSLAACSQLSLAAHLCQALGQDETIQAKLTTRRRRRSTTAPPTCPDTSVAKPPDAVTHRAPPRSPVPPSDPASRVAARR